MPTTSGSSGAAHTEELVRRGAGVTVCSHLGRPKGIDPAFTLRPVAERMAELTDVAVEFETPAPGGITVLEHPLPVGETANDRSPPISWRRDDSSSRTLSARSTAPRLDCRCGRVAAVGRRQAPARRARGLGRFLEDPDRPYVVVLGGAKVSDNSPSSRTCCPVDRMLVGGGCASPFSPRRPVRRSSLVEKT